MRELSLDEIDRVSGGDLRGYHDPAAFGLIDDFRKARDWALETTSAIIGGVVGALANSDGETSIFVIENGSLSDPMWQLGGIEYEDVFVDSNGTTGYYDQDTDTLKFDFDSDGSIDAVSIGGGLGGSSFIVR